MSDNVTAHKPPLWPDEVGREHVHPSGALVKVEALCTLSAYRVAEGAETFRQPETEQPFYVSIPRATFEDMGSPPTVTITVRPNDQLNRSNEENQA